MNSRSASNLAAHSSACNNSGNDSKMDAAATQLALGYIRDFQAQVIKYRNSTKMEDALVPLNCSASLLSTAVQPQLFNPAAHLEVAQLFIDLHEVMSGLASDADALWACVALLQHCSRNEAGRRALVEQYRFVPLLAHLLKRTVAEDKRQRVLSLLQELTYGIHISWEEPWVALLLEQLVQRIYAAAEDDEEQAHAMVALSILINLCHKNFVVLFLLLRSVNISAFSLRIKNFGILASQMFIILSEDMHAPDERELHAFLRSTFGAVDECIKQGDVQHLRQVCDFVLDARAHSGLHLAMLSYTQYCEDIERLLEQLEARSSMDDSSEDSRKQQQLCMGLLFQLISYILELSAVAQPDGSDNVISLDSIVPRIFELLCSWIESDVCGVNAVRLLESLVRAGKKESIAPRIARDPSILAQLMAITEKAETTAQHSTAILQLLLALLHQTKTEKLILSKITESYFDKILAPLLASKPELPVETIALADIEKSVFCLLLLINFAGIAKKAYFEKCCTLLQSQQIQYALARAMLSASEKVCDAVFQISQFEHFPQAQVAKFISNLNAFSSAHVSNAGGQLPGDQWRNFNAMLKSHQSTFVSKEIEERLQALIEVISCAHRSNQLNNVASSQLIELFSYKQQKFAYAESSMQQRLEQASSEITNLTQRINLQNAELQKYNTMNFELHINLEGLQSQCKDFRQQKDTLKKNNCDIMKKLSEYSEALQINEKRLAVKVSEMIVLQKEHTELKQQLHSKTEEVERLQASSKENVTRIDKLKKTVSAFESDIKEKLRTLEEKDRELFKTQKMLEEQREAKQKSDGVMAVLEAKLQEKREQLRACELELSETEEMRKTIMSLMESKKPKRKA